MNRVLVGLLLAVAAAGTPAAGVAQAEPGCGFSDPRWCDISKVYYCPDTGRFGSWLMPCPSLVTGPYAPGGLQPGGGLAGVG